MANEEVNAMVETVPKVLPISKTFINIVQLTGFK